jgi:alpha-beta hydrolase superfamily lysophospholipase
MTTSVAEAGLKEAVVCQERTFATWDGTELFYRAWLPAQKAEKALILFHRGHEHSGRFQQFVEELGLGDVAVFAWDARGHGRSPGERGYADSFSDLVRDVDCFVRHTCAEHGIELGNLIVMGHSVGAVAVAAWVHDYGPAVRAMVLATPALRVKLYVPLALPALRGRMLLGGKSFIKSYVRAKMLTHDAEQAAAYEKDELISRSIATNVLIDLHDLSTRLIEDAGAIVTPTLLLSSGSDWVVKNSAQRKFFESLSSPVKEMGTFPGFYHAILHEAGREQVVARIREFIVERFEKEGETPSLVRADEAGYTRREYERLSKPAPWYCPKGNALRVQRGMMKSALRLSEGIRLGWRSGFDSGESLDGVYRNRAKGITPLGKLIDWFYLNSIGWRGIRVRKQHLMEALSATIEKALAGGEAVRIVDIAAGPGRYLLETLKQFEGREVTALLRDWSENGLEAGRKLAGEMGVTNVRYERGDAFSRAELAGLMPRPNVAVVSGLYELFPGNGKVRESLAGLAEAVPVGGYLIYTNQPWHPQVEMIARVLTNREGKPWVMRRRTQGEMDELVREAGFEKVGMRVDRWGIFTVSVGRRVAGKSEIRSQKSEENSKGEM